MIVTTNVYDNGIWYTIEFRDALGKFLWKINTEFNDETANNLLIK